MTNYDCYLYIKNCFTTVTCETIKNRPGKWPMLLNALFPCYNMLRSIHPCCGFGKKYFVYNKSNYYMDFNLKFEIERIDKINRLMDKVIRPKYRVITTNDTTLVTLKKKKL